MDGPLWLTRPEDIMSHLVYASAEIPSAVLTTEGMQVHGSLAPPDQQSGNICFAIDSNLDGLISTPDAGRTVKLDYEGTEDCFSFLTEVVGTDMLKRWVLKAPTTIERTHQRLIARHIVASIPDFGLVVQMEGNRIPVDLQDISNAGCSFAIGANQGIKREMLVDGVLEVPGLQPLKVSMEIRNMRPILGDSVRRLVGVRFNALAPAERSALARALSAWRIQQSRD